MSVSSNIHEEDSRDLFRQLEEPCDDEIDYDEEEEEFPTTSIRVLIVDADLNSSLHMKDLMTQFSYQVTSYENGEEAIDFLKKSKHEIDLVIWDFHNHEINGVEALKIIRKEMDLPVVILSNDYEKQTVKKSTKNGVCDFLVKPVSKEVIAVLWQHVFRKRMSKSGLRKPDESDDDGLHQDNNEEIGSKNTEDSEEENTSDRKRSSSKKPRMTWTPELHNKFELAIEKFGSVEKAYPKQILKYMQEELNVEGLTRNNVASHLQKYRQNCGKMNRGPQETHQEDSGWQSATFTAPKPFRNPTIDFHARVSYDILNHQTALAATNSTLIQYPLSVYNNNNHFMTDPLPNNMSHMDYQFHQLQPQSQSQQQQQYHQPQSQQQQHYHQPQLQPQQQQQQYPYSSSLPSPTVVTKQESGYNSTSSAMENYDPLIYETSLQYDLLEYLQKGYNNLDQIGRY